MYETHKFNKKLIGDGIGKITKPQSGTLLDLGVDVVIPLYPSAEKNVLIKANGVDFFFFFLI